ncbi:MAG: acetyl-CoA carboxylase biotin carboxyl carrier protein [Scytonema sp. PMC 1069.18]|nr:acetyl-CoA carboxylase biotin carboxyl carrier protein [Scytonema sp. PMC 1069.18]MEC4887415.1 acetyl-CoA carboxylase biotin carboxyl carrier protein [Scytonema sp. PMC 1070.18]
MPLDFNEIRQLLKEIAQTDIAEVTLKSEDFELTVRKAVNQAGLGAAGTGWTALPTSAPLVTSSPVIEPPKSDHSAATRTPQSPAASPPGADQKLVEIPSPMVGTFYRASGPGESPFVEIGDRVKKNQAVCIIEAMKLMNEIESEVSGRVVEILVQNGEPVEFGQPLMRINPD